MSRRPTSKTFGYISQIGLQRQLQALAEMGFSDTEFRFFLEMLIRTDKRDGWVRDKAATTARRIGVTLGAAEKFGRHFKRLGVLETKRDEEPALGGTPGSAWVWKRRVRPMSEWKSPSTGMGSSPVETIPRKGFLDKTYRGGNHSSTEAHSSPEERAPSNTQDARRAFGAHGVKEDGGHLSPTPVEGTYSARPTQAVPPPGAAAAVRRAGRLILPSTLKTVLELLEELATRLNEGVESGKGISANELWLLVFGERFPDEVTEGDLYEARNTLTCFIEQVLDPLVPFEGASASTVVRQ